MNERIREIAIQAGEHANSVYVPPVRSKTPGKIWEDGHVDWHDLFNEKFAELIVREAHEVIVVGGVDDVDNVLKHFGVDE